MRNALLACLLMWLAASSDAGAAPLVTVSIIDAGSRPLARKLEAEAGYAGFATTTPVDPGLSSASATAIIRVHSAEHVELRLSTVDGSLQTLDLRRADGEGDSFALRVIEQLRAGLVDLGWTWPEELPVEGADDAFASPAAEGNASARPFSGAAPDSESLPPAEAPRTTGRPMILGFRAGMAASWATGGLGTTPHALFGLSGEYANTWSASATAFLPFAAGEVSAPEGEADVSWQAFVAGLAYVLPLSRPWLAATGLGAGVLVLDVRGQGRTEFEGRRDRVVVGSYFMELGAGRELTSWLTLRATLLAGLVAPRPVVQFDQHDVASLGRWFGTVGLSLDWRIALTPGAPP